MMNQKPGQHSDSAIPVSPPAGLPRVTVTRGQIEAIARELSEPGWMIDLRQQALAMYSQTAEDGLSAAEKSRIAEIEPGTREMELSALSFSGRAHRAPVAMTRPIPESESAGHLILEGAEPVARHLNTEWEDAGVIFAPIHLAAKIIPDPIQDSLRATIEHPVSREVAMASAIYHAGAILYIPKGVRVSKPLHSLFWMANPGIQAWRLLVILEDGAKAELLQEAASPILEEKSLQLGIMEILLGHNTELTLMEMESWGSNTANCSYKKAVLKSGSCVEWSSMLNGGTSTMINADLDLQGESARGIWTGVSFLRANEQVRWSTHQRHRAPRTVSDLLQKTVLDGNSRLIWNGMIRMEPEAIESDGYQGSRNLMVSDQAHVEARPGLEILTDDIRCSHGVTVGNLNPEELFYLSTRGILEDEARSLLIEGFLETALERMPSEPLRQYARARLEQKSNHGKPSKRN